MILLRVRRPVWIIIQYGFNNLMISANLLNYWKIIKYETVNFSVFGKISFCTPFFRSIFLCILISPRQLIRILYYLGRYIRFGFLNFSFNVQWLVSLSSIKTFSNLITIQVFNVCLIINYLRQVGNKILLFYIRFALSHILADIILSSLYFAPSTLLNESPCIWRVLIRTIFSIIDLSIWVWLYKTHFKSDILWLPGKLRAW